MVQIITKEDGANAASLAEKLDKLIAANEGKELKGFVVFVNGDSQKLEALAAEKKITKAALAYLSNGKDANNGDVIARLKINPEVKNTILVYKDKKVSANFVDLDAKDFSKVEEAVKKILE